MTQINPSIPIYLAPADSGPIPHKYVMLKRSTLCDSCGTRHEWSEVFGETRMVVGESRKYVTNRRPVYEMRQVPYNLPIEIIEVPQARLPFCHECHRPQMLSHLPDPPLPSRNPRDFLLNHPLVKAAAPHTPWVDKRGEVHFDPADDIVNSTPAMKAAKKNRKWTVEDL